MSRPERNRKCGKEGLGLSEETVRKLSALLWYNGNDNGDSTDCGVTAEEEKLSNDHQQKIPIKDQDKENTNNNDDLKHCIVEIDDNILETNEKKENGNTKNDDNPQHTGNEVHVEVLHHGKYNFSINIKE